MTGIVDNGITTQTPQSVMLGAGVIYKDFVWDEDTSSWTGTILGATSGGNKLSIVPEYIDFALDGAVVPVEGVSNVKMGEKATIEFSLVELTPELVSKAIVGKVEEYSNDAGFVHITSKALLEAGDYYDNLAFVGRRSDSSPIICVFEKALITGGLVLEGKNGEKTAYGVVANCVAPLNDEGANYATLPYHIYLKSMTAPAEPDNG